MDKLPEIPYPGATWEEARREELRRWRRLTLREKLDAVDELNQLGATLLDARKRRGLAYIDPRTGERARAR